MKYAGIEVIDTQLVRDAVDLARSSCEPFLYNHVMRSWLFAVVLAFLAGRVKSGADPTQAKAIREVTGWLQRYNTRRRHSALGMQTPLQFELHQRALTTAA